MAANLHPVDSVIVIVYMLAVLLFGLWIGRRGTSTSDYFLGNRTLPWGAILVSIVATETSTVTFLSIPGIAAAAGGDLTFLQITAGYVAGRLFVVFFLLPLYFRGAPFTAYEVLQGRFGKTTRRAVSGLFLLTRNTSDALRLFLTALVLQLVLGLDLASGVMAIAAVTLVYTLAGGAKSVIWNDCVQFAIYMIGATAAAIVLVQAVPGGYTALLEYAAESDRLRLFDFDFSLVKPSMTFWAGLAGGAFLTAATHGTDQLMVQRYLSARNRHGAALALGLSGFIVMLQFALFLLIGVGLAGLYASTDALQGNAALRNDQLFANFIVHFMPVGLLGLSLAAVFAAAMSTLSSSLSASASAFMNDLFLPIARGRMGERRQLRIARFATLFFGVLQAALAILFGAAGTDESTVNNVLKVSGFATGPVLGLYLLAIFAAQVGQRAALAGFATGVMVLTAIALTTSVYWPWYAMIGSIVTLAAGWLASLVANLRK